MSARTTYVAVGAVVALLALIIFNGYVALLVIAGLVAIPVAGYLFLDPSQRRRLRRVSRKRLER